MRSRSSCGDQVGRVEDKVRVARRLSIISRSLRMPSTTRSAGASGCRRRVASYRFTRSSSGPPGRRSGTRCALDPAPRAPSRARRRTRRPRASTTMATRAGRPGGRELGHLRQQRGRQVVDDEVAEVLERLGRLRAAGAGHARDHREVAGLDARLVGLRLRPGASAARRPSRRSPWSRPQPATSWSRSCDRSAPAPARCPASPRVVHVGVPQTVASEPNRLSSAFFRRGADAGDVVERRVSARFARFCRW